MSSRRSYGHMSSRPSRISRTPMSRTTLNRPRTVTSSRSVTRPPTSRPRTARSALGGMEAQQVVCAVSEKHGLHPVVGFAFVNLDTCEAVLGQVTDSPAYARTLQKLYVFTPCDILIVSTAANPKTALFSVVEPALEELEATMTLLESDYWSCTSGVQKIHQLALAEDLAIYESSIASNELASSCLAAVLQYVRLALGRTFTDRSLRMRIEPEEDTMLIDIATVRSLELLQNLQDAKSKHCLFKVLDQTHTAMGGRLMRSSILQPLTSGSLLALRHDAVEEFSSREDVFFALKKALKGCLDADKLLSSLVIVNHDLSLAIVEHAVNKAIMLRQFLLNIPPIFDALATVKSALLIQIRDFCRLHHYETIMTHVTTVLSDDIKYSKTPIDIRNNRTYAVNAGVNGLLDAARQTYETNTNNIYTYVSSLTEEYQIPFEVKFDSIRQFFLRLNNSDITGNGMPAIFTNIIKKKGRIECTTLELVKLNAKVATCHNECLLLSDETVHDLLNMACQYVGPLFKISESIAMLDLLHGFASLVTTRKYCRPIFQDVLGIKNGRHPIKEQIDNFKFVPNDVFATTQKRFQIVTGSNMSGKSTYIRSIALMNIMAQVGSFVPAEYASFPLRQRLLARVAVDNNGTANVSSFAAEMREMAFILKHIDNRSIAIIDELGRGTSPQDGLAVAIAIAEALIDSRAFIWFATHYTELAAVLAERSGVVNMHLTIDTQEANVMRMLYKIAPGAATDKHYGIMLAKTMPFPPAMLERAEFVAKDLERRRLERQQTSSAVILQRKRKLLLDLKEHLMQANESTLEEDALGQHLNELQREFIVRMSLLNDEEATAKQREAVQSESIRKVPSSQGPDSQPYTLRSSASRQASQHTTMQESSEFTWTGALE